MHSPTVLVGHTRNADLTHSPDSSSGTLDTERQASPAIHDATRDATQRVTLALRGKPRDTSVRQALTDALHAAVAAGDFVTVGSLAKLLQDMSPAATGGKPTAGGNVIPFRGKGGTP